MFPLELLACQRLSWRAQREQKVSPRRNWRAQWEQKASPGTACVPKAKLASAVGTKSFSWDCLRAEGKAGERSETDEGINCPSSALRAPSPWRRFEKTLIRPAGTFP